MKIENQSIYQNAIKYAAKKHQESDQKIPGTNIPYVVHLSNVAMEILFAASQTEKFNLNFAVQLALLHDTIEDTSATFEEIEDLFGLDVAKGVSALTKNESLPKEEQMQDSLNRILALQNEVWAVKLADRIANLQPPPAHWTSERKIKYKEEAQMILNALREGNGFLAERLERCIERYELV